MTRAAIDLSKLATFTIKTKYEGQLVQAHISLMRTDILLDAVARLRGQRESGAYEAFEKAIVGMISIGEVDDNQRGLCRGAWEVKSVAGPGYGDVLYAIAFGTTPKGLLTSDRMDVSLRAVRVWERIAASGRRAHPFERYSARSQASCTTFRKYPALNAAYEAAPSDRALAKKLNLAGVTATTKMYIGLGMQKHELGNIALEVSETLWGRMRPAQGNFVLGVQD